MIEFQHFDTELRADPSRVVLRPFSIATPQKGSNRAERIARAVAALSDEECEAWLEQVDRDFFGRHWQTHAIFLDRYRQVAPIARIGEVSETHAKLIGAFFSHEYSYAAAAVMNPSIVPHPDQTGVSKDSVRFILSLRTVGEGHISSISFREGVAGPNGDFRLWPQPHFALAPQAADYDPDGGPVKLHRHESAAISGTVIFPVTRPQSNGLEDLRLVQFTDDDGSQRYLGTYTAYSGHDIGCEMLSTDRFSEFELSPLRGAAAKHKGLALFPRKLNGRYAAIGRLDHESLYYLESEDCMRWESGERIMGPKFLWELVQLGNCGSPIEIDEGWLLLTHGVGAMRQYSLGLALLDKANPAKVLARSAEPILTPLGETREGYVPNVVYTCGAMKVGDKLLIPYAVADSSVRFGSARISDLLASLS